MGGVALRYGGSRWPCGGSCRQDRAVNLVCPACATTNRVPGERLKDQPVCGRCSAKLMPAEPVALDDTTFPKYVANTDRKSVV